MIIGKLDRRITLQQPVKTPDDMGGSKPSFENVVTVWAEFRTPSTKEVAAMGTMVSELNQLISIWRRSDVRRGWRVIYGNLVYKVQAVFDPDKQTTILVCQEVSK